VNVTGPAVDWSHIIYYVIVLQTEVIKLRQEVAQLKTMLIAHSDCPVTRRQRTLIAGKLCAFDW
jgi:hypothetical protein